MVPTTKDGKHEVVFPEDFWYNHGFQLRAALEGRVTWELLGIGTEDPERARRIVEGYKFQFGAEYPLDDPEGVLADITIPHTAKIINARTKISQRFGSEYQEGDLFLPESKPITMHPYVPSINHLNPLEYDSNNLFGSRPFSFENGLQKFQNYKN